MPTLREIAQLVQGRLTGDPDREIHGASTIRDAEPGDITFANHAGVLPKLANSRASAVLIADGLCVDGVDSISVPDPDWAFAQIVQSFRPQSAPCASGQSRAAHVDDSAQIDPTATVYPGAVVYGDVHVGPRAIIHANVCLMDGCRIGADSVIFPGAILYENTIVGQRCVIHGSAVLGGYGFGYKLVEGRHQRSVQLGNVVLEDEVEIGACSTVDRGTYSSTTVGEGTKIDNQVQIGHNCRIGRHNLLCSQVGIAGSCSTGDYVVMAGQVGIGDHLDIGNRVTIGAQSGVMHHIADDQKILGSPATAVKKQMQIFAIQNKLPDLRKQINQLEKLVEQLESEAETRRRAA